jgi:hypothetical protein
MLKSAFSLINEGGPPGVLEFVSDTESLYAVLEDGACAGSGRRRSVYLTDRWGLHHAAHLQFQRPGSVSVQACTEAWVAKETSYKKDGVIVTPEAAQLVRGREYVGGWAGA